METVTLLLVVVLLFHGFLTLFSSYSSRKTHQKLPLDVFGEIFACKGVNHHQKDVEDVKFVINYDMPCDLENYVHRIGRTGRSSNTGTAYTFFTPQNSAKANDLIAVLKEANQVVNPKLVELSMCGNFGRRDRRGRGRGGGGGRAEQDRSRFNRGGAGRANGFGGGGGGARDRSRSRQNFGGGGGMGAGRENGRFSRFDNSRGSNVGGGGGGGSFGRGMGGNDNRGRQDADRPRFGGRENGVGGNYGSFNGSGGGNKFMNGGGSGGAAFSSFGSSFQQRA